MTFEELLLDEMHGRDFGAQRYVRTFKKRPHVSKSKIDMYSNARYLEPGEFYSEAGYDELKTRYIASVSMTYDMMLSIYDVNSRSAAAARFTDFSANMERQLRVFVRSMKRPNFEVRVFGLQDGQERGQLHRAVDFILGRKLQVYEADLFGKELRHVALDLHTGMSYNVLMMDRLYKPGELANGMTMEQFQKSLSR